ncbi:MAG TPA: hypothetical protein VGO00_28350, partial [Kofleriaceae bacterium]|nr:hypothetical protein [Kofleriaceae bacterium]
MTRRALLVMITVLVAAFATLVVVGARLLARDRATLVDEFSRDRLHALQEGARSFADDVKDIGNDLDLASALLQRVETDHVAAERELHAVATVERAYMVMEARGAAGFATQVVALDAPPEALAWTRTALDSMLQMARVVPGALHVSGPLDAHDERSAWYRVFAR